jgi:AraC-like DNA-binding protein
MASMSVPVAFDAVGSQGWSTYRQEIVEPAANPAIGCTWVGVRGWSRTMRIIPDGCCDISFDGTSLWATPAASGPTAVRLHGIGKSIGVRLRPESARAVLGDLDELPDGPIRLTFVWRSARYVEGALATLDAPTAQVRLLIDEVLRRHRPSAVDRVVGEGRRALDGGATVTSVARDVGMSERHLRREFTRSVGIGPKQYARLARFQRALEAIRARPELTFAELAASSGFADEAHLARECRTIAGRNLTSLRRASVGRRRIVLPGSGPTRPAGG